MRVQIIAVAVLAIGFSAAAPLSPQDAFQAAIADENKDYAQVPHAMLKIQDAAYLGEGQAAVLEGVKGRPGSWHWHYGAKDKGALRIAFEKGKLSVMRSGKTLDPALAAKSIVVDRYVDVVGQPTQVGAGINGWRLFVYNQKNPAALNFTGLSYYPFDPKFRVTARFSPDAKLTPRVFRTSRGIDKKFYHAGDANFVLAGKTITLPFYADDLRPIKDMSAFYTDALTGKGAYGAGRYVDVEDFGKFPPARVIIDFNQAYNPNCACSAYFTCPLASDAIPLAMTAGERDPHMTHL